MSGFQGFFIHIRNKVTQIMAKNKEQILSMTNRRYDEVDGIRIQSLNELELSTLESLWAKRFQDEGMSLKMRAELLAMCIVDENGNRVFATSEDDISAIQSMDSKVSAPLYRACRVHVGLDDPKDLEAMGKGSEETGGSE